MKNVLGPDLGSTVQLKRIINPGRVTFRDKLRFRRKLRYRTRVKVRAVKKLWRGFGLVIG